MPEQTFRLSDYDETIRAVLESGGEFTIFPRGTSMLPLIVQGRDGAALEKAPVKPGDIAFYQRADGSYILHRVILQQNGSFTMCGDNQLSPEPGIKPEQIIARVKYLTRKGKKLPPEKLSYRLYVFLWRSFFIRRVYFKLRRLLHGGEG